MLTIPNIAPPKFVAFGAKTKPKQFASQDEHWEYLATHSKFQNIPDVRNVRHAWNYYLPILQQKLTAYEQNMNTGKIPPGSTITQGSKKVSTWQFPVSFFSLAPDKCVTETFQAKATYSGMKVVHERTLRWALPPTPHGNDTLEYKDELNVVPKPVATLTRAIRTMTMTFSPLQAKKLGLKIVESQEIQMPDAGIKTSTKPEVPSVSVLRSYVVYPPLPPRCPNPREVLDAESRAELMHAMSMSQS